MSNCGGTSTGHLYYPFTGDLRRSRTQNRTDKYGALVLTTEEHRRIQAFAVDLIQKLTLGGRPELVDRNYRKHLKSRSEFCSGEVG